MFLKMTFPDNIFPEEDFKKNDGGGGGVIQLLIL